MRKHISTLLLAALFLIGMGLLAYPAVSDSWNAHHQSRAIAGYVQSVTDSDAELYAHWMHEAETYNAEVAQGGPDFLLSEDEMAAYRGILNPDGSGVMASIEIKSIGCSLPVYHGTDDAVLQIAVGHIAGSSLPIGGESTHCVLSGHRGLPSAKIFTELDRLVPGDTFVLRTLNEILTYEVDDIRIVLPSDVTSLGVEAGADLCTLVTCTPYGVNSHRLLVRGHRIPNQKHTTLRVSADALVVDRALTVPLFAAPAMLIGLTWIWIDSHRKEQTNALRKKLGLI